MEGRRPRPTPVRHGIRGERLGTILCVSPAVALLMLWAFVPLAMTIWFSLLHYNLMDEGSRFIGLTNYKYFFTDPDLSTAIVNTVLLVFGVLAASVVFGMAIALILYQQMYGRWIVRLLVIAPFFVMPTVSALVWKNLLMNPVDGLFAWISLAVGLKPFDWFAQAPLFAIGIIVAWQWVPFATLVLLTAMQSLETEQLEAARIDGAGAYAVFSKIMAPHLARPVTVVILIETIFLLSVFAEILVTTAGGPGDASTNLPYLIYKTALLNFDIGGASAGGLLAVVLANLVAIFLVRTVARSLDQRA